MDIANSHGNSRSTDAKSLLDTRLADLQDTVRRRQKGWAAALAAASDSEGDLAQVIRRERAARIALEQQLAERKARYEIDIARADAVRAMIDEQIREAALAVERAQQAEAAAVARVNRLRLSEADAVARLAEREDQFATELSTITATYDALEQQLSAAESALDSARHRVALAVAEVERLTRRELELTSQSVAEAAVRASLEHRVADVEAALLASSEQLSRERTHAAERVAADQARLEQEISTRRSVEEALDSARSTHADAERRHESAMAAAAAVLAERETELTALLAEAAAIRSALERRAVDAESALSDAQQQHRAAMATAATQLAEREALFATELASIIGTRDGLEQQLHDVEARLTQESESRTALEQAITELRAAAAAAEQNFRDEIGTIVENARTERARQDDRMSRERHEHQIQLADEQQQHRTAMATAAARLAEREAQFETELASIAGTREKLEQQLREVEARLTQEAESRTALEQAITELRAAAAAAEHNFRDEIATITENASAERARLEDEMSRERHSHQSQLADEQQQHRTAMATAATQLAAREEQFQTELASIAGTRDRLEQQLHDVEARLTQESESRTALEQAITELRAAAAAAELDFREEIGTITGNARAERARLEDQMSHERREHQVRLADEQQQHRTLMANAATQLVAREAQFKAELTAMLAEAAAIRSALEHRAAAAESALSHTQQQHHTAMATAATQLAAREEQFRTELASIAGTRDRLEQQLQDVEARLTQESESRTALDQAITELRAAAAAAELDFREEIATITGNASAERARLEDQMSHERREHQIQLADEQQQHRSAIATAATQLAAREVQFETELASIAGTRDRLEQQLHGVEARLTQETESRTSVEQAITELRAAAAAAERGFREEIGTLTENTRTERARLEGVIAHQRAVAADRLAAREAEFAAELKRLSKDHATALGTLQASAAERDSRLARATATLRSQLDASEAENLRQFEQTPVPLIRCTQDGALTAVNQAFAVLVGCRAPGELRDKDFAATRFESRDDLVWLIERSMNTGKTESLETTCVTKDGTRIAVRLSARPSASGLAECAVEDLTAVRVLEERLREAHRMESVGRLAREVAATCEKQLRDVYRDAQRLLMMTGAEAPQYSRTLLDEVTRVGGSLRQLVTYGHEQAAAQAPVDVNRILGDLESVLKQVAGDVVTLELRKGSSPVHVDVKAERVERLLVNVASYGRERMPHGGRLRIELSTVVVDGKFIAQYPNVRQGPHALITVIEVPRPATEGVESDQVGKPEARSSAVRPGVDLGALQELIAECGGHLWITAEPGGSMVVKMRLPLRAVWMGQADGQARHRLGRVTARLFGR